MSTFMTKVSNICRMEHRSVWRNLLLPAVLLQMLRFTQYVQPGGNPNILNVTKLCPWTASSPSALLTTEISKKTNKNIRVSNLFMVPTGCFWLISLNLKKKINERIFRRDKYLFSVFVNPFLVPCPPLNVDLQWSLLQSNEKIWNEKLL